MSTTEILQSPQKLTSAQLRKIKKPIIEKRRRERINESLNQLKALVLEALDKDENQYNKMEKADILEMTVKHLRCLQRQVAQAQQQQKPTSGSVNTDAHVHTKTGNTATSYQTGYSECAEEVRRYLGSTKAVNNDIQSHLTSHLSSRLTVATGNGQSNACSNDNFNARKRGDSFSSSRSPSPASSNGGSYSPVSRDSFSSSPSELNASSFVSPFTVAVASGQSPNQQQTMYLSSQNVQLSPIFSGHHSFVPIVISPMAGTSQHMQLQHAHKSMTSPLNITSQHVIPLYPTMDNVRAANFKSDSHHSERMSHHSLTQQQKEHPSSSFKDRPINTREYHQEAVSAIVSEPVWRPW